MDASNNLPNGSCISPIDLSMDQLLDKYKNIKLKNLLENYHKLANELYTVQVQLREISIVENYKQMTKYQQDLMHIYDKDKNELKTKAGLNNVIIMSFEKLDEVQFLSKKLGDKTYYYTFANNFEEATKLIDEFDVEFQNKILVSPMFITI